MDLGSPCQVTDTRSRRGMSASPPRADLLGVEINVRWAMRQHLSNLVHWLRIAVPPLAVHGFVLLVLGYLVLLAGNVFRNGGVGFSNANIVDARR